MSTLLVLCRFVHFAAVLMLFGAWALQPLLLGRQAPTAIAAGFRRWSRWGMGRCSTVSAGSC